MYHPKDRRLLRSALGQAMWGLEGRLHVLHGFCFCVQAVVFVLRSCRRGHVVRMAHIKTLQCVETVDLVQKKRSFVQRGSMSSDRGFVSESQACARFVTVVRP